MTRFRRRVLLGAPTFLALAILPACPKISRPPDARPAAAVALPRGPIISRPADVDVPTHPTTALRPAEFVIR